MCLLHLWTAGISGCVGVGRLKRMASKGRTGKLLLTAYSGFRGAARFGIAQGLRKETLCKAVRSGKPSRFCYPSSSALWTVCPLPCDYLKSLKLNACRAIITLSTWIVSPRLPVTVRMEEPCWWLATVSVVCSIRIPQRSRAARTLYYSRWPLPVA
jgi:hypothetical protein